MGNMELGLVDNLLVALFGITVTMTALAGLYACVRLFSLAFEGVVKPKNAPKAEPATAAGAENGFEPQDMVALDGLDEAEAAAIMAIVSHESSIPLSELRFKSIKAVK